MKTLKMTASIVATIALALVVACDRKDPTAPPAQQAVGLQSMQASTRKVVSVTLCSPSGGGFTLASTNPYWPLTVGRQLILNGEEEGASHTLRSQCSTKLGRFRGSPPGWSRSASLRMAN
jgi:hypothetical protein